MKNGKKGEIKCNIYLCRKTIIYKIFFSTSKDK